MKRMVDGLSKLSFKIFCIENYAEYKNMNSSQVYKLFDKTKLLELLDLDYEDLHGMGLEYLMKFIDEYLETKGDCLPRI